MPVQRASRSRRRSSHTVFTPARPGVYGKQQQQQQRPVTFAPNVTPVTFTDNDDDLLPLSNPTAESPTATLFPPSETPAPAPARKRCPPGKRRSQGYIPRPPNAFMLFRADFVRQKHVPGSIETNHGSLSKIIGQCWRQLPFDEKRVWEVKARAEKAKHKAMYPLYRFRPVHKKKQGVADDSVSPLDDPANKRKDKQPTTEEDERRCDAVAQLLLEGKKGEELAQAVRDLDRERELHREMEMGYLGFDGSLSRRDSYDMELGYDSRGPSPMLSSASSSTAPSLLHMPLPMYVPPSSSNFYGGIHHNFPRRPSSVPLPIPDFFASYSAPTGIALPSLPSLSRPISPVGSIARHTQHHQFLHPFHNPFDSTNTTNTADFQFPNAPIAPSPQYAQQAFAPFVQPSAASYAPTSPFGMYIPNSQRSSLGLGHRRASSAQAMLMRSWTMPIMGGSGSSGGGQVERDHSPLPDVEAGLFDDFSFGGSSVSVSVSVSGREGSAEGEVGVDPMGAPPTLVGDVGSTTPTTTHAYSESPPLGVSGLPDMTSFEPHHHHHPHPLHHQHQQLQPHQQHHLGMGDMLDMSAYGMYADVDPIERSLGVVGMEEGMMKADGYFEGVGAGVYEV